MAYVDCLHHLEFFTEIGVMPRKLQIAVSLGITHILEKIFPGITHISEKIFTGVRS